MLEEAKEAFELESPEEEAMLRKTVLDQVKQALSSNILVPGKAL